MDIRACMLSGWTASPKRHGAHTQKVRHPAGRTRAGGWW
jgi:hypothetical protein